MMNHKLTVVLCLVLVAAFFLASLAQASGTKGLESVAAKAGQLLNINQAPLADLANLGALNKDLAKAIVDYRGANGAFGQLEDLLKVKGMTQEIFDKIKPFLTI